MNKCPRCFSALNDDRFAWTVSPLAGGDRYLDPVASAYAGTDVESGSIYSVTRPPGFRGPLLSASDAAAALNAPVVEICPVCHMTLPEGWRGGDSVCIAMAGTPATGKSTYLAVLIKRMALLCEGLGISMQPVAQTEALLIFTMGARDGIPRYLVIRDIAGEDLESGDMHSPRYGYFGNADAVFFMFDPLRVKGIRDQLHDLLPAQAFSAGDPRALMSNVLLAVGAGRPKLAVILSKFDALRTLGDVEGSEWSHVMSNAGAAYLRDPSGGRHYDDGDGELLHEEVRSLLIRLHAGSIVAAVEGRSRDLHAEHRFFVVSALGAPFRCTDPARWITSAAGVL